MIDEQRARELDNSMMVTMTRGELAKLVGDILEEKLSEILDQRQDSNPPAEYGLIYGASNIAAALNINRNTFYRLWGEGKLGDAVFHIGHKVAADRGKLFKNISDNGEGYCKKG